MKLFSKKNIARVLAALVPVMGVHAVPETNYGGEIVRSLRKLDVSGARNAVPRVESSHLKRALRTRYPDSAFTKKKQVTQCQNTYWHRSIPNEVVEAYLALPTKVRERKKIAQKRINLYASMTALSSGLIAYKLFGATFTKSLAVACVACGLVGGGLTYALNKECESIKSEAKEFFKEFTDSDKTKNAFSFDQNFLQANARIVEYGVPAGVRESSMQLSDYFGNKECASSDFVIYTDKQEPENIENNNALKFSIHVMKRD